jgi:hypothetical protein
VTEKTNSRSRSRKKEEMEYLHAEEVLEEVDALGVVLAGLAVTVADVELAPGAAPPGRAGAGEAHHLVSAGPAIEAGAGRTVVDVDLAHLALEALPALALELVVEIQALGCAGGVAEVGGTLVDGGLAGEANETGSAVALEGAVGVWKRNCCRPCVLTDK